MRTEPDDIDRELRKIFLEEWRVDGFGDQHVADAMRRAYKLGYSAPQTKTGWPSVAQYAKAIEDFTAKKLAEGPEACRRHLIDLGVYDEAGNLTPQYGGKE